ncbi:hypothetical protein PHMEG_00030974 [Phytophthora megakarya]|uniref:Uncharacterized protein n=1 Tax=Phytophthora megakarya TaxID=4795 RepID=A0A225UYV2_9STRA|nr:hypothetical protein PHMEG_00030974 [Phytophthora megakarya]
MVKSRPSASKEELLKQLVACYVKEDQVDDVTTTANAQVAFWSEMREVLSVNESSAGLDILDDIAEAVIDRTGYASDAFGGPILILPNPTRQKANKRAELHPRFVAPLAKDAPASNAGAKNASSRSSTPRNASSSTSNRDKKRKERSSRDSPPPSKRKRPCFNVELAVSTPQEIRDNLENLYRRIEAANSTPWQLAYPWEGSISTLLFMLPTGVGGITTVKRSGIGNYTFH